jgi:hypothetical protein
MKKNIIKGKKYKNKILYDKDLIDYIILVGV